jgi:phosphohistidine phosphatase
MRMKLVLVRHAIAIEKESADIPDEQRPLTPEGIRKMKRIVAGFQEMNLGIEEVWTSPLMRTLQTAELIRGGLHLSGAVREVAELRPNGDVDDLLAKIHGSPNVAVLAIVGHEPFLGRMTCRLLAMDGRGEISFKKGGAACIELDSESHGTLEWLLTPKQLRQIGRKQHC